MFDSIAINTNSSRCAVTTAVVDSTKYRSLTVCTASRQSLRATIAATATKAHEYESIELKDIQHMTPITQTQRSVSCFELGSASRRYQTIRIGKDSAELQQLAQANVAQLLQTATSPTVGDSNNALLARKALRYRKKWTAETESCVVAASC